MLAQHLTLSLVLHCGPYLGTQIETHRNKCYYCVSSISEFVPTSGFLQRKPVLVRLP